ncbi:uncharacterized protein EV154DRAFT_485087 [Mucor mucedo]|uniref:uncharacterized protein n=1 Tax=Mucor mucedo TaxID=29922 RepID=UPI00221FD18D|nr:uncharacterized protein EV154DRAFT_485087 [Mucor mucedo]KAI7886542.1 hypothetical protein EV154DRAFT_485087 [Mucor mucedo]
MLSSEFRIIFSCPEITKFKLPFDKHPINTDVTYKAVSSGYYLVSSVIYVEEMKKHMVFFQAVIKHQTAEQFAFYFKALFKKYAIVSKFFLGILLDFYKAEQRGFHQACDEHFNMDDKSSLIIKIQRIVPAGKSKEFISLAYMLQKTTREEVFFETGRSLKTFLNCLSWLQWWLDDHDRPTIFNYDSNMKQELQEHESRTTNGIESFHKNLCRFVDPGLSLGNDLRQLMNVAQVYGNKLANYYENVISPVYGSKKRKTQSKRLIKTLYEASDSRPPDNINAIYSDKSSKNNKKRSLDSAAEESTNFYEIFGVDKDANNHRIEEKNKMEDEITAFFSTYDDDLSYGFNDLCDNLSIKGSNKHFQRLRIVGFEI